MSANNNNNNNNDNPNVADPPAENQNVDEILPLQPTHIRDGLPSPPSHQETHSVSSRPESLANSCHQRKNASPSESIKKDTQPSTDENGEKEEQEVDDSSGPNPGLVESEYVFDQECFMIAISNFSRHIMACTYFYPREKIALMKSGAVVNSGCSRLVSHWSRPHFPQLQTCSLAVPWWKVGE